MVRYLLGFTVPLLYVFVCNYWLKRMLKNDEERKAWSGVVFLLGMVLLLFFNAKDYVFSVINAVVVVLVTVFCFSLFEKRKFQVVRI